jgi:hypothetical protein
MYVPNNASPMQVPNNASPMQVIKQSTLGLLLKSSGIEKKGDARDVVTWGPRDNCYAVVPLGVWFAEKRG